MFNLYSYEQKKKENQRIDKQKNDYLKLKNKRRQLSQKFSENYKKRVEQFQHNMKDTPLSINEYKSFDINYYNFRPEEQPEKFKGHGIFKLTGNIDQNYQREISKIDSESVNETGCTNQTNSRRAASVPKSRKIVLPEQFIFRQRQIEKEIQPDMRFTSKTTLERIHNFLKQNTQTQISNIQNDSNKVLYHTI